MKMLRSKINLPNLGFGLALVLLVAIAFLSYQNTRSLADLEKHRRHSLLRLDQLLEYLGMAVDIETGERGYVVTGDPRFLEPFHSGMEQIDAQLNLLHDSLPDDPSHESGLATLAAATVEMRHHYSQVVYLKENKEDEAARRAVATGRGKSIMDRIRQCIKSMRAEERKQLRLRDERYQTGLHWSTLIIVAGSLMGFAAVGLAAAAVNRGLRDRTRLNEEMRRSLVENNRMLDRLRTATEDLTGSNQELEQFAYIASHDLQEPLRKVSSFAQLLAAQYRGKLDADADLFIGYMVDGARRMQALIQNLLAYSRLGRKGHTFQPADSENVLRQAIANLQEAIEQSGAVITSDPLPSVLADEVQMIQLFQNLIGNAIKFHGADKPLIHVGAALTGPSWTFCVRDNGIGIDPVFGERIFVIFQRLHSREEYPGTGIGLAYCKKIVERHGGRIWLGSELGRGAAFYFTLSQSIDSESKNR